MTGPTNHPESYYIYDGTKQALEDANIVIQEIVATTVVSNDVLTNSFDSEMNELKIKNSVLDSTYNELTSELKVKNNILDNVYNAEYNCLDVLPQDPEYISFNLYLSSTLATTTLASNASIDATTVVVTSATGITTGKAINIRQDDRFFQSLVTNVAGTTITLASPLDYAFTSGATVRVGDWNLNKNGSVTPVIFKLQPPQNAKFYITAISITMTDDATMDNSKFGSLNALTNGLLARRVNGIKTNMFLITNNAGFYQYGYDTDYPAKVPAGIYAFQARKKIKDINGNVISLNGATNDEVEVIVRDDLSALTEFTIQVHGHIVEV